MSDNFAADVLEAFVLPESPEEFPLETETDLRRIIREYAKQRDERIVFEGDHELSPLGQEARFDRWTNEAPLLHIATLAERDFDNFFMSNGGFAEFATEKAYDEAQEREDAYFDTLKARWETFIATDDGRLVVDKLFNDLEVYLISNLYFTDPMPSTLYDMVVAYEITYRREARGYHRLQRRELYQSKPPMHVRIVTRFSPYGDVRESLPLEVPESHSFEDFGNMLDHWAGRNGTCKTDTWYYLHPSEKGGGGSRFHAITRENYPSLKKMLVDVPMAEGGEVELTLWHQHHRDAVVAFVEAAANGVHTATQTATQTSERTVTGAEVDDGDMKHEMNVKAEGTGDWMDFEWEGYDMGRGTGHANNPILIEGATGSDDSGMESEEEDELAQALELEMEIQGRDLSNGGAPLEGLPTQGSSAIASSGTVMGDYARTKPTGPSAGAISHDHTCLQNVVEEGDDDDDGLAQALELEMEMQERELAMNHSPPTQDSSVTASSGTVMGDYAQTRRISSLGSAAITESFTQHPSTMVSSGTVMGDYVRADPTEASSSAVGNGDFELQRKEKDVEPQEHGEGGVDTGADASGIAGEEAREVQATAGAEVNAFTDAKAAAWEANAFGDVVFEESSESEEE